MKKVWLDTDIGSDIDDALALAYLLSRDDCDLVGLSTVTEAEDQRAQLASALCRIAQRNVPIYPGLPLPLLVPPRQTTVPQAAALPRWPHQTDFPQNSAIDALRAAIRASPGEISLLAIGPMTNLGVLFALDPEIASLLKELVLMCGAFAVPDTPDTTDSPDTIDTSETIEWNAINDPHAAALTYRAAPPHHLSLGLNVTQQVTQSRTEFEAFVSTTEMGRCILDMAAAWFQQRLVVTFHDPLAAAMLFEPSLCHVAPGQVEVEWEDPNLRGKTHWTPRSDGPHEIAVSVDAVRFLEHFWGVTAHLPRSI